MSYRFHMLNNLALCLQILERLVGFDTTSHKSNADLIHSVQDYLTTLGIPCTLIPDAAGEKFNLIATIGDPSKPGVVLSGHTDVVPADITRWQTDPFSLRREGERVYGRGTTDMKGFLSIVLAAVPSMLAQPLAMPITLAFTHDEEVGCFGAQSVAPALAAGQHVIVGEPTMMHRGTRHKGARIQTLHVTGVPAHSGTPALGISAIEYSQTMLTQLISLGQSFEDGPGDFASSLLVTSINGGGAPNVVPAQCDISWLFRPATAQDAQRVDNHISTIVRALDAQLKKLAPQAGASLTNACDVPMFRSDATPLITGRLGPVFVQRPAINLDFATEAGVYHEAGHSVVVCGPGDMAQGHIDDEFIELSALQDGINFIDEVIHALRS